MIENYDDYPSKEEMIKELTDKRLGYDFVKDKPYNWEKLAKKKDKTKGIEKYWLADHLSKNLGDITQIKSLPETDVLFYSSPCTDYSGAGKQAGSTWTCMDCGHEYNPTEYNVEDRYTCPICGSHNIKSTRSGLLFEVERLIVDYQKRNKLPKYLMLENVAALVSKKFINDFNAWVDRLDNLGYTTYWKVLNSKECGVPQSRPRVFCISIRKDIDTKKFTFPKPFDSGIRLKDVLENDRSILEKYFLSDEVQSRLVITDPKFEKDVIGTTMPECRTIGQRDVVYQEDCIIGALMASDYKQPKQIYVGDTYDNRIDKVGILDCDGCGNVDKDVVTDQGICPALQTHNRHNVIQMDDTNKPIQSGTLMGKYEKMMDISRRVYDEEGISPTIHTCGGGNTEVKVSRNCLRVVRKLTPKECFRLQDFDDVDYERCAEIGMSDTQGYHCTGNSITVKVIELLAQHLYKAQYDESYVCLDEMMTDDKYVNHKIMGIGQVSSDGSQGGKVYGIDGVSQTIMACPHGYGMGNIYDDREVYSAASRGRYDENGKVEQHLEINSPDYSNCLTSVQKDSLVVEVEKENFMNPKFA